jgi:hypothetical protein
MDQVVAVATVLALAGALAWFARRASQGGAVRWSGFSLPSLMLGPARPGSTQGRARVTARVSLTPQHCLHRVETGDGLVLLLATHSAGITVIEAKRESNTARAEAAA